MNEELKIIIRAATQEAEKNMRQVRQELDKIETSADKSGKAVDKAMATMAKAATVVIGTITAVTAAMVTLGKRSLEFQKVQGQLTAGFQSAGMSAEQALTTYTELFSFLGDASDATEAANLLAQLTNDTEQLSEWTSILQGVYATFPKSLPIESLAEAINHTAQLGEVQGTLADALEWSGVSVEAFNAALANTSSVSEREALIRGTLNSLYSNASQLYAQNNRALIEYNQSQVALDKALADATRYVVPLLTALNNLASTLLTVLKPAFETISAVIIAFIQWIIAGIKAVGTFFGVFDKKTAGAAKEISTSISTAGYNTQKLAAGAKNTSNSLKGANKEAEKLKRNLMGFDELNVISSPTKAADVSYDIKDFEIPAVEIPAIATSIELPGLDEFEAKVEAIKERLTPILTLVGLIGLGIGAWKIADFLRDLKDVRTVMSMTWSEAKELFGAKRAKELGEKGDLMYNKMLDFAGVVLMAAGAIATAYGYSDAWVNGIDWGNFGITIAGLGAIIGGLYLSFGPLAASIGGVVAGISLLVLGVQDFIKQGPTVENTITIIGGAFALAIASATLGLGPLLAAIVGVTAAAVSFAIAIWNEEPAIMSVEDAQNALTEAKNRAADAENGYINAVDAAEAAMKRLAAAEEKAGITGEELYKQVQDGTLDYADMTDVQKELYKAYLDNEKKQKNLKAATEELTAAKKAETLASYEHELALAKESGSYDDFKKSVVKAFKEGKISAEEAQDLISKSMSEMSDDARQTFMKDLPDSLKNGLDPNKYDSTATKIKRFFSNLGSSIVTTMKGIGSTVGEAISKALKNVINNLLRNIINKINGFIDMVNSAIGLINKIPGVNITKLSRFTVPQLATGGITTGATLAMIGERGKEAVLPLENNTGWMDALADRIAARSQGPSKIVLQVGEKELGWAAINSINSITKQTGRAQLHIL